jgi:hypothetical protein
MSGSDFNSTMHCKEREPVDFNSTMHCKEREPVVAVSESLTFYLASCLF